MPPHPHDTDHHRHGLAHDLVAMRALAGRRDALRWVAGLGAASLVSACGIAGGRSRDADMPGRPVADPEETGGPFPADGTNRAPGAVDNVLGAEGIVRSDIRSSFIEPGDAVATGTALSLALTLVDVAHGSVPLGGHAIYLWCCDASGAYSLYTVPGESYQRGVQVTDARGRASFTLTFPGCYDGRWPHLHFEVFPSLWGATSGDRALLTSQFALPEGICRQVYADPSAYPGSAANFARVTLGSDMVFGDNSPRQIARQTPAMNGSPSAGYAGRAVIGLAR